MLARLTGSNEGCNSWLYTGTHQLERLTEIVAGELHPALLVMEGDFTVESDKHVLVDELLALLGVVCADRRGSAIHQLLTTHLERIFPPDIFDGLARKMIEFATVENLAELTSESALQIALAREQREMILAHRRPEFVHSNTSRLDEKKKGLTLLRELRGGFWGTKKGNPRGTPKIRYHSDEIRRDPLSPHEIR